MTHVQCAKLIPWYANGTLAGAEALEVESHLAGCAACREALGDIRALGGAAAVPGPESDLLDHPSASMLWVLATAARSLPPGSAAWLREHLEACQACADTQPILQALARLEAEPRGLARLWAALSATVLRPVPAMAYLAALLLAVTVLVREPPSPEPDFVVLPPPVRVFGNLDLRAPGARDPVPLLVPLPATGPLHLELQAEVDPLLLEDPSVTLRLEVRRDGAVVLTRVVNRSAFDARGALRVLLDQGLLPSGSTAEIALRIEAPGGPVDGQVLFRRVLVMQAHPGFVIEEE